MINRNSHQFYSWWRKNRDGIEKRNLHTFSGMYRTVLGEEYYQSWWEFHSMLDKGW